MKTRVVMAAILAWTMAAFGTAAQEAFSVAGRVSATDQEAQEGYFAIDHETMIGTATHICPGARLAGRVTVESGAFVGIGATVIQSIRIGYEAVVGAGDRATPTADLTGAGAPAYVRAARPDGRSRDHRERPSDRG